MTLSRIQRRRFVQFALLLALPAAATFQSGCVAVVAAAGAGTGVAWYNGRMDASLEADLDRVYRAAQQAIAELEFAKVSEAKSAVDGLLISRTALDKKVEIKLVRVSDRATKVSIRVGVFGDEPLTLTLFDKIKSAL